MAHHREMRVSWNNLIHVTAERPASLAGCAVNGVLRRSTEAVRQARGERGVAEEHRLIDRLGSDLELVWNAPTTTARDHKELLRTLLTEVIIKVDRPTARCELTLRWRGGALTDLAIPLPHSTYRPLRTDEKTLTLIRRLAIHYPDGMIASILNRQGRRSARGARFTAILVSSLRTHWHTSCYQPPTNPPDGQLVTVTEAARQLSVAAATLHRWLQDGFIGGEQLTPGAPWQIRLTDDLRARFTEQAPPGWLTMWAANEGTRRFASDRVAACQARPVARGTRSPWTPTWTTHRSAGDHSGPLRTSFQQHGGIVTMVPRTL
jgi:hypothetical protein